MSASKSNASEVAAPPRDDFGPTADWPHIRLRAELLGRLRAFFAGRGYLEVETPLLSADTVIDRHLDPFVVQPRGDERGDTPHAPLYLQTSPELAMKRLLAAGGEAIFQVTHAFRSGERGRCHNPEFTIVEWYRRGDDMEAAIETLSVLCDTLLRRGPAEQVSFRRAFEMHVGIDPHAASTAQLAAATRRHGLAVPQSIDPDDRDAWLDLLLVERVEPHLGRRRPTIVYDYPASQAALARLRDDGGMEVAERFELYIDGIELANGYHELVDADALRERMAAANDARAGDGKDRLPEDNRLIDAMRHGLPACAGVALGLDRVVMLAAGAKCIDEVIAFPIDRA